MKKLFYCTFLSSVFIVSCKKDITNLNINPNLPVTVTSASLFSNAVVNLADVMASTNVNNNNFRLFVQYWTETIYRDETRYNLNGRSIADRWWATFYRNIIKDLTEASKVAEKETLNLTAAQIKNRKAIDDMLIVYCYYTLISSFGDVPYTDALNIDKLQPAYDNAATVFTSISTMLDASITALDATTTAYGSADFILNDDVSGWQLFGNSLKLRMGMLVADSDPATAKTMVEAAAPAVIATNAENIKMNYLSAPPNTNPVWEDLIQSGRHDFVAASTLMNKMKSFNDPRIPYYFDQAITAGKGYVGQTPGVGATFNDFSAPSAKISETQFPHTFFSYSEMEFLKAEAAERGFAVGGTAAAHYNNAIDASFEEWGGTAAEALIYRTQPAVNYATAPGTYKEKIGTQAWIALYNRGYDAWTEWRRLDYPVLPVPTGALFADGETPSVIKRLTYPVVEQNLNKTNYQNASKAIGNDQITQKLWFDKF
jgi:Starch-binding associating with outer membrane